MRVCMKLAFILYNWNKTLHFKWSPLPTARLADAVGLSTRLIVKIKIDFTFNLIPTVDTNNLVFYIHLNRSIF